jgi:hypothetical protein
MKSRDYPCAEEKKPKHTPVHKMPPGNILGTMKKYSTHSGSVLGTMSPDIAMSLHRLVWNTPAENSHRIVLGSNVQVMTDTFRRDFNNIFTLNKKHIDNTEHIPTKRRVHGKLEIYWPSRNIPLTNHHVLPKSRGGRNTSENYFELPRDVHDDFHDVFGIMTPIEQLAFLTLHFKQSYNPAFIRSMCDLLLSKNQNAYYKTHLLRTGKIEY